MNDKPGSKRGSSEPAEDYSGVVEAARDVVFTLTSDGTVSSLNPAFRTVTGWSPFWAMGEWFDRLVCPDDLPLARMLLRRVLNGETIPSFRLRVRSKSKGVLISEMVVAGLVRSGMVVGVLGVARDMTGQQAAEQLESARREMMALLQRLQALRQQEDALG